MSGVVKSAGDLVSGVFGGILGGGNEPAPLPAPKVEPVTPMPEPDDTKVKQARRRALVTQRRRNGRESTILSDDAETLG